MAVKLTSSRRGGVQDLFHRRSSSGGGSVSSRRSRSSIISSSKRSSNKSNKRGRQSSNRGNRRNRSRSRSRTRSSSKQRQRLHRDENNNTNNLIVNKSFEQQLTQDVESMSASQQRHLSSKRSNTTKHRRRHTADSTTTKSTKSSSTAPTYCHDGIDLLFSDVISPLSGAICTFLTTCLCDDVNGAGDNRDDRHLHKVSSPGDNRRIANRQIPQRSRRDKEMLTGSRRRVSPTVNGVVLKQEEYNVLQPIEGASAVVVEEEEVIMYY